MGLDAARDAASTSLQRLDTLIDCHDQRVDYPALCRAALPGTELEPWHESAYWELMRLARLLGIAIRPCSVCDLPAGVGGGTGHRTRNADATLYERIRAGELSPIQLSAQGPMHNLPAEITPFVGREHELGDLYELLLQPDLRLLTLVGAGGMGKSRLALELARSQVSQFQDGVFFVPLAPVTSASGIAPPSPMR